MSNLFRRIMIIALVSVLVLGVSVSASAVDLPIYEDYGDEYYLCADADIDVHSTLGIITVNDGEATDATASVSVTYRYIDGNLTQQIDSKYQIACGGAVVSYLDTSIFSMIDASYVFWARIPASYGTQEFTPDAVFLEYWPQ